DCPSSALLGMPGIPSSGREREHNPHRLVLRHDAGLIVSDMANGVSKAFPVQVEGFTRFAPALHMVGPSDGERSGPGNSDDLQTIFTHGPDGQSAIRGGFRESQPVTTAVQVGVVWAAEVIHTVRSGQRGEAEEFAILSAGSPASGRKLKFRSGMGASL